MKGFLVSGLVAFGLLATGLQADEHGSAAEAPGADEAPSAAEPVSADKPYSLDDYNSSLVKYGVPFYTHYPASFYTGFAPKVEDPNRVHFRASRGNQVRLTAVLDEYTVLTYLYYLRKRYAVYDQVQQAGMLKTETTYQLDAFRSIVDSPKYNIDATIEAFEKGELSKAEFYQASLDTIKALNPDRVFPISFDLVQVFEDWKADILKFKNQFEDDPTDIEVIKLHLFQPDDTIVLTNELLFGRVNAVYLSEEQTLTLAEIVSGVFSNPDDPELLARARDYFIDVTGGRYNFQTVVDGQFVPALQCDNPAESCTLSYHEFTAVYPNGSVIASTKDRKGNTIHRIRNSALMTFLERPYHDVDHIRKEGYYGYVPKMDWEGIGNGAHNPGVSHWLQGMSHLYDEIDIPEEYKFLWVVSRGPVSSGCVRMSSGHLWEVRHVFPSDPDRMTSVLYFGNYSADYDLFDIDGDGTPEVMGTDYLVAYNLQGPSGDAKRRGKNFSTKGITKEEFYSHLYGAQQYAVNDGVYVFSNPYKSHFRKANADDKRGTVISRQVEGDFQLYEQVYEQDKVQIYRLPDPFQKQLSIRDNTKSTGKQMVRILGRVNACGPFKDEWDHCYEDAFDQELDALLGKL